MDALEQGSQLTVNRVLVRDTDSNKFGANRLGRPVPGRNESYPFILSNHVHLQSPHSDYVTRTVKGSNHCGEFGTPFV